jgi:sugar/nucleoside kinase (ribokinase family)
MDAVPSVAVIGNLNIDLVFHPVNVLPAWGEEKASASMYVRAAGSAGYSAQALGMLGVHPRVIGNVGADHYGTFILEALRSAGVDTSGVRVTALPTGVSVTLTNERGERAFVTYPGHLGEFRTEWVLEQIRSLPPFRYYLLSGYFLLPALGAAGAIEVLRCCRARGGTSLLDTGDDPQGWPFGTIGELRHVLREVDIFLPNREEALTISGRTRIDAAATALLGWGPRTVLVKLGGEGSIFASSTGLTAEPAVSVPVLDTTGAGDGFNAGAIYALANGWVPRDVLRFANALASCAVARRENRFPTLHAVQCAMRSSGLTGANDSAKIQEHAK